MRVKVLAIILLLSLAFLLGGLAYVQLVRYERYRTMSEDNRLKIIPLMAPRGMILDRDGKPLVKDTLAFNVAVIYSHIKDKEALINLLHSVLDMKKEGLAVRIDQAKWRAYSPNNVAEDIGIKKAIHLGEIEMDYPGLLLEVSTKREYLLKEGAAGIFGYLGLINRPEFKKLKRYGYRINDLVGRDGVEKKYDNYLRGKHGGKQVEVDHRGRRVSTLGFREPLPGRDVQLTIDVELQKFCDRLLASKKGAIIAMDPETGAVLAMASAPSFDPEIFVDKKKRRKIGDVLLDEDYPLLNRAIAGAYPPGSVFKTVMALAALETGKAREDTSYTCEGSFSLGRAKFRCWKKSGHGVQTMRDAIKNSCNVYFFNTGIRLGVDDISEYAKKFGIGEKSHIDLPGEVAGVLPTKSWKRKRLGDRWYKGDTVNYSIGQGYLLCTPIQICRMMSVFANGGELVTPYIVSKVGGIVINKGKIEDLNFSGENIKIIRDALQNVVNGHRGTGMKAKLKNVIVSGKTGTSQTSRGKNHGWFAGFAPFDDPKLTVVVFDEYGGKGGYYAAGTAGKVFQKAQDMGLL